MQINWIGVGFGFKLRKHRCDIGYEHGDTTNFKNHTYETWRIIRILNFWFILEGKKKKTFTCSYYSPIGMQFIFPCIQIKP